MEKRNNQERNNEQPQIEDLAVNEDQAAEVKGGPFNHIGVVDAADYVVWR